ncbi:Holliday junction DNA helicase RuvA [Nitratiruptor sp. YY08-26]|uniref:Holliday junction branch migration protein RuvA n=1 Tax=unclassified Nitratiruptor TaxID=2624044 RepID=UPI001915DC2E|nr:MULTISPECIES: Holliday junction branch migration protein RuvA [unclassified Nitratiruptor]BCD62474.1 Holliday junction DNA helicase RuvA [Nitratiruptor sp. YY08-13]BCD66410.1 Holliday junction DNA helicase RuvA [Nitratiruptor sp. YY08-26]
MIVGIQGKVIKKEPTFVHIETGGLIYEVFVSLNASSAIEKEYIRLYTTHIVREDGEMLYGFVDINEKKMFDRLIKLNGVGPKVAMAICSTFKPEEFVKVVHERNISKLKKVPGIGPKSAQRILVELDEFDIGEQAPLTSVHNEAMMALESLGFKKEQIQKVLATCEAADTAGLVKEALKKMQKI